MKPFLRFFLGSALALLASVAAQAAPVMIPSAVSAAAASAAPGDTITISVAATNAGAATTADDMGAGGTVTGTVVFTHRVTGATISTGSVSFSTTAIVTGAGGSGSFTRTFTVPTISSQAGSYNATVTLTAASSGTASGSFSSTSVLTVTGTPDLDITGLTYPAGTAYRGGDVIPMTLSYTNRTSSNGANNVPYVSSTNGNASFFRIEVILSSNPTFGDADDFLLTLHDITASSGSPLNANNTNTTLSWNQILPGNFAGSYYVMAKIDTQAGITETVENDLTDNGNNIYYTPDTNAARISLLPTNFPTVNWASTSGNGYSDNPSVTSDGRYTAFASDSTTLGTGDTNAVRDIFIYDNQTATVRRLSVAQQGAQSNGASNHPAISAVSSNGTYVAFASDATNLALDDTNGFSDIYVVNVFTGVITRVSVSTAGVQANGSNFKPAISVTGRYVAWESSATNLLVAGTTVGVTHIYLRDRDVSNSGTYDTAGNVSTVLISQATGTATPGNGNSIQASVSADGQYVAFASDATNLGGTVGGGFRNIYLRDLTIPASPTTTLASFGTSAAASNGSSRAPSLNRNTGVTTGISADGRHVAFGSEASNLITAGTDTNAVSDIFVYDRVALSITRVSVSSAGAQATDPSSTSAQQLGSINPSISATGRYVAFASLADNLTTGDSIGQQPTPNTDSNGAMDVFVMDRDVSASGTFDTALNLATTMVSKNRFGYQARGLAGTASTGAADIYPAISADGRWVAFPSDAENTAGLIHGATNRTSPDSNTFRDVFLHDRRINALPSATTPPSVSVTSPVTATTYPVNSAITLIGSASAPAGTIASVQFFVNGTSLGTDTSFPYNATWTPTATGTFALSALVTDSFSNQASSSNVNITISAVSPNAPTVSISSPATGAALFANGPTTVSASASDGATDGTIASVQFFANGVSIGTDTTFPYSVQFTPVATGQYTLTAVATDNGGNQTTTTGAGNSVVSVTNLTAPTISITSPTPVSINAATTITATASSGGSIASVQFLANGTTLGTLTTAPFAFSWTPTASGSYSLTAVATDNLGSQTTSATITVVVSSGASPVFSPLTPTVPATVSVNTAQTISAAVTDSDGTVASVRFSVNGTTLGTAIAFPYSVTWTPTTSGTYTILAVATDNLGNQTTSSAASVTVSSGTAPSVSITAPLNLATLANGGTSTITATATPNTGTIANVRFFANGVLIGTDTAFPYTATFSPASNGTYSLTAIATDSIGNQTTSTAISVTVAANQSPTSVIAAPTAGTVGVGSANTFTVTAGDADGTVASVQFFANGVSLGTDTTSPYSLTWTPTVAGAYSLTAIVTDAFSATTTSAAVAMTVTGGNQPTVSITAPTTLSTVAVNSTATITATAAAVAPGTVASVQFLANGVALGTDAVFPYTATWTPTANGTYSLTALVTDSSGNQATSTAVSITVAANVAPTVSVTAPADLATVGVGSTNTVTATSAADTDGSVASVQFFANGVSLGIDTTSPFTATWTPTIAGAYTLTALATDNLGAATTSSTNTITVTGGNAPSTAITAPVTGASIAVNSTVDLAATATAVGTATIASVQFRANGVALGTDTAFPYTGTWTPTANGTYSLTTLTTDSNGNQATSAAISVTVAANASPAVAITAPAASTVGVGSANTFTATATDSDGTIASVQFFANGTSVAADTTSPYSTTYTPTVAGSYSLTAVATDNLGATTTSAAVALTVTGGNQPSVNVTAPAAAALIAVGSTNTVTATATPAVGGTLTIASVQFFANSVSLGSDTTFPYTATFTPVATGTYSITALAIDSAGNQATSSAVSVTVGANVAPSVGITSPVAAASVGVGVLTTVAATATDTDGTITSVQFFANGTSLGTDTTSPYTASFTPTVAGTYSLTATATDNLGITTTSSAISVTAAAGNQPTVAITSPSNAAALAVGGTSTIAATATAVAPATITSVQFLANGAALSTDATFPYTATFTPSAAGTYSLTAVALDSAGNQTTSSAISVTVAANVSPTIAITAPATGTVGVGSINAFTATASDTDGSVASVQFFIGSTSLAIDTASPFSTTFTPTAAGTYLLTAVATDNLGATTTSATTTLTVTGGNAPVVSIGSPATGLTVPVNATQTITATATAVTGTIASVQFFANGVSLGSDTTFPYAAAWSPTANGSYALTALATDTSGNTTTSATVTITVAASTPGAPTVALLTPPAGLTVAANQTILLAAGAADADGAVARVEFLVSGQVVGSATTAPYFTTWTPTVAGTFSITTVATDNQNNRTTSAASAITVIAEVGSVPVTGLSFNNPAVDSTSTAVIIPTVPVDVSFGSKLIFLAGALDTDGTIASVKFYVNGTLIANDTTAPFYTTHQLATLGTVVIMAVATDSSGNAVFTNPLFINSLPSLAASTSTASLSSPLASTTYRVGQAIDFSATHNLGSGPPVAKVDFFLNGQQFITVAAPPYLFVRGLTDAGTYDVHAVARVGTITTFSTVAQITVVSNTAPTVSLTSPATGSSSSFGSPISIDASATATAPATISSVQFFANGSSLGIDSTFPYNVSFNPAATGTYLLTAIATDSGGLQTATTSAVSVSVVAGALPTVAITAPTNASALPVGAAATVTADATATAPAIISSVQFFANGFALGTDTVFPYTATFTPLATGAYTLTAIATDSLGNQRTSTTINITAAANAAPTTVAITAPTGGATPGVGVVTTLTATATDTDGTIASVRFFGNGTLIGTSASTASPYTFAWTPTIASTFALTAVATDNLGASTTSATITVTTGGGNIPLVSLTAPVTATTVPVNTPATLTATATAVTGTIASVEFFANNVSLGLDLVFPYSVAWTPTATGAYVLKAVTTDTAGNQATSALVNVTAAANVAPTIAITAPAAAATVGIGAATTLTATVTDTDGTIASVRFFVNGALLGTSASTATPYTLAWTPTVAGPFALTAIATDNLGATTTSATVNVTASGGNTPTVTITPLGTASVAINAPVALAATTTTVAPATTASVQFFANGVSLGSDTVFPYTTTWTPTALGTYSLTALTVDSAGNQATSAAVSITVAANVAPTVSIGAPINASTVPVGTATTLSVTAGDTDGTVVGVQFFVNGGLLGTDTTSPYSLAWTPTLAGSYTLTAVATDNAGATTTSAVIGVTAGGGNAPTVNLTTPLAGPIAVGSANTVTALANATLTGATIAQVQFFANSASIGSATTFPHRITWTPTVTGTYALTAVATDTSGNQATSSSVSMTVAANQLPPAFAVTVASPVGVGSVNAVTAAPTDNDGTIASVQFFVTPTGGTAVSLGLDTTSPFAASWTPTVAGTYALTAVATDNVGGATTSAASAVTVTGGLAPTITLAPLATAAVANGSSLTLTATAAAATGTIASVQFFANSTALGTDTTFPYTVTWSPIANGTYNLTAIATDTAGNQTTSATVTATVAANVAPAVVVTAPLDAASVGVGSVNPVTATATDTDGSIVSVQFFANGASLGTDTTSPYAASWTPTLAGTYTITAIATDNLGATTTSATNTVTVTAGAAPVVTVTAPSANATVNAAVVLTANATATAPATIVSVQFLANGVALGTTTTFPYTISWTPTAIGAYALTAVALDSAGNRASSATVTVTVAANQVPAVAVTAPANLATVGVGILNSVTATATDPDGSIVSVQFFANGTSLGTDTTFPYAASWTPTIGGTYALTAIATDNVGATTTSATNTVTVAAGNAPTVNISAPPTGSTVPVNVTQSVTATATPAVGTIASVEFRVTTGGTTLSLSTDTTFPYAASWTPSSVGSYTLTALATDSSGNQAVASSVITVTATSNAGPSVSIGSPATGSTFTAGSPVVLFASASDANGTVSSVRFLVDGQVVGGQLTVAPFTTVWTPSAAATYSITAIAVDNDFNATTSSAISVIITAPTGVLPTVAITAPLVGTVLTTRSTVPLTAGVSSSAVNSVQFFDNGVAVGAPIVVSPFSLNWSPTTPGIHRLVAIAGDSNGNRVFSLPVDISVTAATSPTAPIVTLSSPLNASLYKIGTTPATTVTLTAAASDNDGTITKVDFFINGTSVGSSSAVPYTLAFTPTSVGRYVVTAAATDNAGNVSTSSSATFTTELADAPLVTVTSPLAGATLNSLVQTTITASAVPASSTTIASVVFFEGSNQLSGTVTNLGGNNYSTTWTPPNAITTTISARATASNGFTGTSVAVPVTVTATPPPTVAFTSPAAGDSFTVGSPFTISVTATPATGLTISTIEFFVSGISQGGAGTSLTKTFTPQGPALNVPITVRVVDSNNNAVTTPPRIVNFVALAGPTVALSAPTAGATIPIGTATSVTANVTLGAPAFTVTLVEFFVGGTKIGSSTTAPYTVTWLPTLGGSFNLTATAKDINGTVGTSPAINVTVSTPPATVSVTSPAGGATLGVNTAQTITANATVTTGTVVSVQFLVNGVALSTDTTFPFSAAWLPVTPGTYALTAKATDNFGTITDSGTTTGIVTVTVTNGGTPTVSITSPAPGAAIALNSANTLTANAAATANGATIASVQFFANGILIGTDTTSPYSTSWSPISTGAYALTAVALDTVGNQAVSAAVSVNVGSNQLPTVAVTAPTNASTVGVGSVNAVTATAGDADGTITSVQFFANGVSLGTDLTFPYSATWTPTVAGTYALTAVAVDNVGGITTSATNAVTVTNGSAPTIAITAPTNGSAIAVNTTNVVTASAAATAPGATITSVQFFANGISLGTDVVFPYTAIWSPNALGTYAITAVATDSTGNQATSAANSITISTAGGGIAPTVSLTSPNAGATYVVGQPVTMGATVGLGASFITGVQFFVNNTLIGGGATPPTGQGAVPFWTASWTPAAAGAYTVTAVVTDANGVQVTSAAVGITVSPVTVPTVSIASPSNATSLAPTVPQTLVASVAVTNASVFNVQFFANNVSLGTVTTFPYTVNWTPATTGSYSVIAVVTTSAGVAVTSAPVIYDVASGTPPIVTISSPASVNVGFPQNIIATAVATQLGTVIRDVQFFVNGFSIGIDTSFPFNITWTPVVPSSAGNPYLVTAVATDTLGNRQTSAPVSVTANGVSTAAPTVSLVAPANNSTVAIGTTPATIVTLTASARDTVDGGTIASVQFFANGLSLGTVSTFPYTVAWTPVAEGTYTLTALAIDNGGNQTTSAPITVIGTAATVPLVTIATSAAANTSTVNTPVTLTANATAAFGRNIPSVQFFASGQPIGAPVAFPYTTTWTPTAPGVYAITATATDNLLVSGTSAAANITVTSGTPPIVNVTSPGSSEVIGVSTPQTFTATATPSAPASISSVRFLINGVTIGSDNSSPYTVNYTPLSLGAYTLTAVATDSLANNTTSSPVNFTVVAAVGPTTSVTAPATGASGPVGSVVTVAASAVTTAGTISSVQFFANGVSIGTDTTEPYTVSWLPLAGGNVALTAVATDNRGITGAISSPVNFTVLTPPATIAITGPGAGATLSVNTPQTITATASATNGTIVSVQFFVNGVALSADTTFPFSASWTPQTAGSFSLTARATDNFGTVTDSGATTGVVTVTVSGGTAPAVSISSPANSSTVGVGLVQTIVANATAVNGTIANVQFFANGLSLGTDPTFPYNQAWTPAAIGTYNLTAVATDVLGNQTTSAVAVITVAPVSPNAPVVALTAPTAGASLPVGATTLLAATATDPDGSVASVEFFANGISLGVDLIFPYNVSFTPTITGAYVLTARATDNGGNITTSAAVTISVSGGTAPSVAVTSPASGVTLGVNLPQSITASATSSSGFIKDVQFFLNGQPLSVDATFPYAADWIPAAIGTYTLTARATDNLGNIADSAPVVVAVTASAPPTVRLTNPVNGSSYTVGATLNLTADSADPDGAITGVQFLVNGLAQGAPDAVAPYTGTWSPGSSGVYTLTARATDNTGNTTTSAPVTVTIGANAAPTVALTSPAAGTYSLGNLVLVSAGAADADGSVTSVQFFANGLSIGTSTTAPFNTSWRPTLAGTYRLTGVATDNVSNVTTSSVVSVTITSTAAPAVTISNPVVGQPYGVGTLIPFTANTSGGNGPISQLQFFVNGTSIGVDTESPYSANFTPNAPGTFSLLAIATDSAGLSSSSAATIAIVVTGNTAPTVVLTSPPNGTNVNGGTIVNLTAIATDIDGNVASVRFLANGNQVGTTATAIPYGTAWAPSAAGTYRVTAQATDNSGNVTNSLPIDVTVVANAVPTVALTSPSNGSTVRVGSGATLAATAADTDGTIASVQFFANGLSIGTDTTSPYSAQWTPGAEGIYRITAVALDNSGAATTSSTIMILAIGASSGGSDTVYTGTYSGSGELGRFAAISIRGKTAAFIGFSTTTPNRVYFYDSLPLDLGGGFFLPDSLGRGVIAGSVNDTGASGTLDAGRVTFIGPVTFPTATGTVASGLYSGNLSGRPTSMVNAIVGADGSIFVYMTDGGSFRDAGAGALSSTGAFAITTSSGNRFIGRADPVTGFLSGTLTGGPGGTFTAALASGVSFSDGFLRNLSTRGPVGTGSAVLVAGFAVSGSQPKRVLIRAIGPTLAAFGVTGALADTRLELFSGSTSIGSNDNWGGAANIVAASAEVGAFALAATSLDSVIIATLPPGLYTAQVSGVGGGTGLALVELYDLDTLQVFSTQKLTNVATRAVLTSAQNEIIAGFMVSGSTAKKVLIRAVGPTLGGAPFNLPNTLANPMLSLVRSDGVIIRENDDWSVGNDASLINEAAVKVGAFALTAGAKDSAILINLPPGTYNAQISGAAPGTGTVLVEVYEVP